MFINGFNSINPNYVSQSTSFKGDAKVSNPSENKVDEFDKSRELASKEAAYATRATAMAQILTGNNLKFSTTPEEYEKSLTKQGKIKDKDYSVKNYPSEEGNVTMTIITELNSKGEKIKETQFTRDNMYSGSWNEQHFYSPNNSRTPYKSIEYSKDGGVSTNNNNVVEDKAVDSYKYRPDGSLEYYNNYQDEKGKHYSKNGKITEYSLDNKDGELARHKFDDDGNLISVD